MKDKMFLDSSFTSVLANIS